jgi:hypothetical protein
VKPVNRNHSLLAIQQKETGTLGNTNERGLADLNLIITDVVNKMATVKTSFKQYRRNKEANQDDSDDEQVPNQSSAKD